MGSDEGSARAMPEGYVDNYSNVSGLQDLSLIGLQAQAKLSEQALEQSSMQPVRPLAPQGRPRGRQSVYANNNAARRASMMGQPGGPPVNKRRSTMLPQNVMETDRSFDRSEELKESDEEVENQETHPPEQSLKKQTEKPMQAQTPRQRPVPTLRIPRASKAAPREVKGERKQGGYTIPLGHLNKHPPGTLFDKVDINKGRFAKKPAPTPRAPHPAQDRPGTAPAGGAGAQTARGRLEGNRTLHPSSKPPVTAHTPRAPAKDNLQTSGAGDEMAAILEANRGPQILAIDSKMLTPKEKALQDDWLADCHQKSKHYNEMTDMRLEKEDHLASMYDELECLKNDASRWEGRHEALSGACGGLAMSNTFGAPGSDLKTAELHERLAAVQNSTDQALISRMTLIHMDKQLRTNIQVTRKKLATMRTEADGCTEKVRNLQEKVVRVKNETIHAELETERYDEFLEDKQTEMDAKLTEYRNTVEEASIKTKAMEEREDGRSEVMKEMKHLSPGEQLSRTHSSQQHTIIVLKNSISQNRARAQAMEADLHRLMRVAGRSNVNEMLDVFTEHNNKIQNIRLMRDHAEESLANTKAEREARLRELADTKDRLCMTSGDGPGEDLASSVHAAKHSTERALELSFEQRQDVVDLRVQATQQKYDNLEQLVNDATSSLFNICDWLEMLGVPFVPPFALRHEFQLPHASHSSGKGRSASHSASKQSPRRAASGIRSRSTSVLNANTLTRHRSSSSPARTRESLYEPSAPHTDRTERAKQSSPDMLSPGAIVDYAPAAVELSKGILNSVSDLEEGLQQLLMQTTNREEESGDIFDIEMMKQYYLKAGLYMDSMANLLTWMEEREAPPMMRRVVVAMGNSMKSNNFRLQLMDPFKQELIAEREAAREPEVLVEADDTVHKHRHGHHHHKHGHHKHAHGHKHNEDSPQPVKMIEAPPPEEADDLLIRSNVKDQASKMVTKHLKTVQLQNMHMDERPEYMKRRDAARHQNEIVERLFTGQQGAPEGEEDLEDFLFKIL